MAEVKGKRLLIAAEIQEGARLNDSIVAAMLHGRVFAEKVQRSFFLQALPHAGALYQLPAAGQRLR